MSYHYGIQLAKETIIRLTSDAALEDRLSRAWSEMDVMENDDATSGWYAEVQDWKSKYLNRPKGFLNEKNDQDLVDSLLFICGAIIEENNKLIKEEEKEDDQ